MVNHSLKRKTEADKVTWTWNQRVAVGFCALGTALFLGAFLLWMLHSVEPIHRWTSSWYDIEISSGYTRDGDEKLTLNGDQWMGSAALAGAIMWLVAGILSGAIRGFRGS